MGIFFLLRISISVALAIMNFSYFFSTYKIFWGLKYRIPSPLGSPPPALAPKSKANLARSSVENIKFSEVFLLVVH